MLCVAALPAACQKPHPPTRPSETVRPTVPSAPQRRASEARWLDAYPEAATREGNVLTIRYAGREVAHYQDDPKGCNPYSISKVIEVYDAASARLQPLTEVTCHFGNLDNRYLVLPTSDKYTVRDDVTAAPDGKTLAMADNALGPTDGDFTLIAWPSMARIAGFKAGCRNATWQDSDHLKAICWHNNGSEPQDPDDSRTVFFTADIHRDEDGKWHMTGTGFVDGFTARPVPAAGRPLPRLTAAPPPPDRP
jgi:hypothetical protein